MTQVTVREALAEDAAAMSQILRDILSVWKSERPSSVAHVSTHYVNHPDRLRCSVAVDDDGEILGFQSLKRATEVNAYGLPEGWGIIGTYVNAKAAGRGVGKALFASSLDAAREANVTEIDATIGAANESGLAFYDAIGFHTYQSKPGAVCKKYTLA
ncbi:GNAT family N-acetyltransferase [Marivita hallyeonensis]|uniref:L-amino acid N-acyltransferase YncA n=1 Tax=Marivita hallyeonensis TaxID=996342 RepID=A0A1M5MY83_9RHOB|nr:GNAT family N-acetyltransferase [Marivita hallyeonensis]SHG82294.1 L-amino acid N-acyltransferase YncA [Marivita hallyeonensis]